MEEVGDFEDSNNQDIFIQINWPSSVVDPPNQPNMDWISSAMIFLPFCYLLASALIEKISVAFFIIKLLCTCFHILRQRKAVRVYS